MSFISELHEGNVCFSTFLFINDATRGGLFFDQTVKSCLNVYSTDEKGKVNKVQVRSDEMLIYKINFPSICSRNRSRSRTERIFKDKLFDPFPLLGEDPVKKKNNKSAPIHDLT